MQTEIKPVILPNINRTVKEVTGNYNTSVENIKQEIDVKIEYEDIEEIKQEKVNIEYVNVKDINQEVKIENKYGETYDDCADKSYDVDKDQDESSSEESESDNSDFEKIESNGLVYYIRINSGDANNKAYFVPNSLKPREKKHICTICSKAFPSPYKLKIHMNIHNGVKSHLCEVCNKSFTRPDQRKSHMSIHTGEKPYTCDVCNKAFSHSHHLKIHKNIHTGKKPYNCEICSKGFTQHTNLKRHIRTHNKEKLYSCEVCGKNYTSEKYLVFHRLKFHELVHK